jgi:hypothetical protein
LLQQQTEVWFIFLKRYLKGEIALKTICPVRIGKIQQIEDLKKGLDAAG